MLRITLLTVVFSMGLAVDCQNRVDVLLSSGLLAFSRHIGFLRAVEGGYQRERVGAVIGTSSGALVGALWAAGYSSEWILRVVRDIRPIQLMRFSPWRWGLFSLQPLIDFLRPLLPATIESLPIPFAAGVAHQGTYELVRRGPLASVVAASCAIPWLFQRVRVDNRSYYDGGAVERLGLESWQRWRGGQGKRPRGLVHWVESSTRGCEGPRYSRDYEDCDVVITPASGASFFHLGNVEGQAAEAAALATAVFGPSSGPGQSSR